MESTEPRSSDIAVTVRGLGKRYRTYKDPMHRVLEKLSFGRRQRHLEKWAFRDLSFEVPRGTALGIVGVNGAGKSTLLKVIGGTTPSTEGTVTVDGQLGSLLELGGGFHPEFPGDRNVFMNAAIMGIPRRVVRERLQEIQDFADLGPAFYRPIRTYSSGMMMRLGFAVATMQRPDVLILDEVMAVGDQSFQKKCMERIREIREAGTTILFVSHSIYHIRHICDRAIWLHDGGIAIDSGPIEVTDAYLSWLHSQRADGKGVEHITAPDGGPKLGELRICPAGTDTPATGFASGVEVDLHLGWLNPSGTGKYHIEVLVFRNDDVPAFSARSKDAGQFVTDRAGVLRLRVPLCVSTGEYYVCGRLLDATDDSPVDTQPEWGQLNVLHDGMETGLLLAECQWMTQEQAR